MASFTSTSFTAEHWSAVITADTAGGEHTVVFTRNHSDRQYVAEGLSARAARALCLALDHGPIDGYAVNRAISLCTRTYPLR